MEPTRLLPWSAAGVAGGIALSVLDLPTLGAISTVPSLLLLVYAVHAIGRLGPDSGLLRPRRRGAGRNT